MQGNTGESNQEQDWQRDTGENHEATKKMAYQEHEVKVTFKKGTFKILQETVCFSKSVHVL